MTTDLSALAHGGFANLDELIGVGYIQEVNRRFFHPLGLALVVGLDPYGVPELAGILDCRADPDGIIYAPDSPEWSVVRRRRARAIEAVWQKRVHRRKQELGFGIQSLDTL